MILNKAWYIPALIILCCSCGNKQQAPRVQHYKFSRELEGDWYRHYSGIAGGDSVIINLYHYDDRVTGFCYHLQSGELTTLNEADEPPNDSFLYLEEYRKVNYSDRFYDDNNMPDQWAVSLAADGSIKGRKYSRSKGLEAVSFSTSSPNGSYPLSVVTYADSLDEKKGKTYSQAITFFEAIQPAAQVGKPEADMLSATVMHLLGADSLGAASLKEYSKKETKKFFENYVRVLKDIQVDSRKGHGDDWEYNFVLEREVLALYNDNGWLCLEVHDYNLSGGGSDLGTEHNTYTCLDMQGKRIWRLADMLNIDQTKLSHMLEQEVRRIFEIQPADSLSSKLAVNTVPFTDNVFITSKGIIFCFNPMTLGTEPDGEICILLPYDRLKEMLKPEFKTRMNL